MLKAFIIYCVYYIISRIVVALYLGYYLETFEMNPEIKDIHKENERKGVSDLYIGFSIPFSELIFIPAIAIICLFVVITLSVETIFNWSYSIIKYCTDQLFSIGREIKKRKS